MARRPYSRHLVDVVTEFAERTPDRTAVISGDDVLSYAELAARTAACSRGLHALGVRRGATVGLLCTNRWEWIVAALGAMGCGARVATFNTFARDWDLEYMLEHSGAEVLISVDGFRNRDYRETLQSVVPGLERLRDVVIVGDPGPLERAIAFETLLDGGPGEPPAHTSVADEAFVLYTSGSGARPKAVPLQQFGVVENGFAIGERMGLTDEDRVWVAIPLFWAYGATNALPATLGHGATLVLQPAFEPAGALELIERHRCTAGYILPNITAALLAEPSFSSERIASLTRGLTLGTPDEFRRAATELGVDQISNIYGGTENYGNCCVTPSHWPLERRAECQGPPLPGVQLRVIGEDGAVAGTDEVGAVQVRGYVSTGYIRDESGASAAFLADGWFDTGDLGSLDDDGCMHFSARATEMIKTGGINVAPREVEEFLAMHPEVAHVAVVGVSQGGVDEDVVAFIVATDGAAPEPEALRRFCKERIAAYKVPVRVHVVDAFPATDTGKLLRRELITMDKESS